MAVDFTPSRGDYTDLKPFRFWCQKVLPLVYDDALSYYELLCKVVDYLNKTMEDVGVLNEDVGDMYTAFGELQNTFNTLQQYVDDYFTNLDVQEEINNKLDEMASDGTLVRIFTPVISSVSADVVTEWLEDNLTPTSPPVDATLTISGAAADAKVTGNNITNIKTDLEGLYLVDNSRENPTVTRARYIALETGIITADSHYAITSMIQNGENIAFKISGDVYEYAISLYDATGDATDGTGYLGRMFEGYTTNLTILPKSVEKFIVNIRRIDRAILGSAEGQAILNSFVFYRMTDTTLTVNNTPADSKTVGQITDIMVDVSNHSIIPPIPTSSYPTGWRTGKYDDTGAIVSSNNSICRVQRIGVPGGDLKRRGAVGIIVDSPYGCCVIKRFNGGNLISTVSSDKKAFCSVADGDLVSVTITNLTSPETYITDSLIDDIHVYVVYKEKQNKYYTEEEYFTVSINKTWVNDVTDAVNTVDVDCVLKLPPNYSPADDPVRLIFMHHGNSGTVNVEDRTWYSESTVWVNFVNAYLNAGYAVFDVNGCGPVSEESASHDYGAFGALQAAYKAYNYIKANYNIKDRIFVHGSSMGGATVYAFAKTYGFIVDAIGLFSPALLSRSAQIASVDDYIATNFGYSSASDMVSDSYSHLYPFNPKINYYDDGVKTDKPFTYDWVNMYVTDGLSITCDDIDIPIKIWCGTADTAVDPKYGEALSEALTNGGKLAIFRPVDGATHNAGIGSDSTVNAEAVMWFNRFN